MGHTEVILYVQLLGSIIKMTPIHKAIIKTAIVIIGAFVLLSIFVVFFNLDKRIFSSFLFDPDFYQNLSWRYLSLLITIALATVTALLGYKIAKRKNRNAQNWAGLCFLFNIWGVIFLSFLPPVEKYERNGVSPPPVRHKDGGQEKRRVNLPVLHNNGGQASHKNGG